MTRSGMALMLWVPVSALFMADRNRARGFSIAMLSGMLLLPEARTLQVPGILPDLGKPAIGALGVLLGTIIFHPMSLVRFRPRAADTLLALLLVVAVLTSVYNGLQVYEGLSSAIERLCTFILPVFLARVHLNSPRAVRTFLYALVCASVAYAPLALWEWRMSPQIHRTLYGYFQHVFRQHVRGGYYRPVVCLPHSLVLGRFFAFVAFLSAFPLRKHLARWSSLGPWLFLAPLGGLLLTQSYGPCIALVGLCGLYFVGRRWIWPIYAVPVAAVLWLGLVFAGARPLYTSVDAVAKFNTERAESLQYRLKALEEYRAVILERPVLGHGRFGRGRIAGRATDSAVLVYCLTWGFAGAGLFFGWWFWTMHVGLRLVRGTRGSPFSELALGIAAFIGLGLAISVIDSALDTHIVILGASLPAVDSALRRRARLKPSARVWAELDALPAGTSPLSPAS